MMLCSSRRLVRGTSSLAYRQIGATSQIAGTQHPRFSPSSYPGLERVAFPSSGSVRTFFGLGKWASQEDETTTDVVNEAKELHDSVLRPLNSKFLGPLEKRSDQMMPKPMVFVLGNHSSGKSTFINYVVGKDVQTAGVAPTDDSFSVVVPGKEDVDQDGPALVGDPELGFEGLRSFGGSLINHVNLKVRKGLKVDDIMLVDSPGMIDSPVSTRSGGDYYDRISTNASPRDRGYNFPGVIRWFAERADVILLFFDPDKPGTTGETLACMTNSLVGLDHKLHIIMNKVDQFRTVHDFARAYGSLCWNLSKVIPRKDLPRIYTMCLPSEHNNYDTDSTQSYWKDGNSDLKAARKEIVREVSRAPMRRADNVITRLYDSVRSLKMHVVMVNAIRQEYRSTLTSWALFGGLTMTSSLCGSALLFNSDLVEAAVTVGSVGILGTGLVAWKGVERLQAITNKYTQGESGLDEKFRDVHHTSLAEQDDFVISIWEMVKPQLQRTLQLFSFRSLPRLKSSELQALDDILETSVPRLRRHASRSASFNEAEAENKATQIIEANEQESEKKS
eukprot:gb/GECG01015351.1/.p1 GENE.gb/GECG01015351.1/~~gb/GECG01015351.1/.p1  ORF type:complete len:561 (+),score=54.51 gb/GECG01015351.1/:1-1683(+)